MFNQSGSLSHREEEQGTTLSPQSPRVKRHLLSSSAQLLPDNHGRIDVSHRTEEGDEDDDDIASQRRVT